jgi:hypothetical protein
MARALTSLLQGRVHMRSLFVAFALLVAAPAFAQVQSRPTDPPIVTADNESWYRAAEPLQFAGDLYFPAGAKVFFNGNTMVRTGHYNGVPIYADTTFEPYSVVFIPISRGLMQPYERRRRGDLAGTTGSRTPSFPVGTIAEGRGVIEAAAPPTDLPRPIGAISVFTPDAGVASSAASAQRDAQPIVTLLRPESNDGIWIRFSGSTWISAGSAVPLSAADFQLVGDYAGFPVFARQRVKEDIIYLPTRAGLVAPYRRKP